MTDLQALADVADANVAAAWLQDMSLDYAYVQTKVRGLQFENDQEVFQNAGAGPGTLATQALPGNVSVAIKKTSGLTGRSARGRLFWVGLAREQLDTNENLSTQVAIDAIVANMESMRGSITQLGCIAAIVSRFSNGVARDPAVTFTWTSNVAVDRQVDSLRGRLL